MRPSRSLRVPALTAILVLAAVGCDRDGDAAGVPAAPELGTLQAGRLTVCSDVPYAPFEIEEEDGSGYSGFDIELMEAVAGELGLDLSVAVYGFDELVSGDAFAAGACDVAASAIEISEERDEHVDFTEPYFDAGPSLLVRSDAELDSLADIATVGVQAGTVGHMYAEENFAGRIIEFTGPDELVTALQTGTIDGILQDLAVNAERVRRDGTLEIVEAFPTGERFGFAVAEGDTVLREALDTALRSVRDAGTYDELHRRYFGASQ